MCYNRGCIHNEKPAPTYIHHQEGLCAKTSHANGQTQIAGKLSCQISARLYFFQHTVGRREAGTCVFISNKKAKTCDVTCVLVFQFVCTCKRLCHIRPPFPLLHYVGDSALVDLPYLFLVSSGGRLPPRLYPQPIKAKALLYISGYFSVQFTSPHWVLPGFDSPAAHVPLTNYSSTCKII